LLTIFAGLSLAALGLLLGRQASGLDPLGLATFLSGLVMTVLGATTCFWLRQVPSCERCGRPATSLGARYPLEAAQDIRRAMTLVDAERLERLAAGSDDDDHLQLTLRYCAKCRSDGLLSARASLEGQPMRLDLTYEISSPFLEEVQESLRATQR